jgi:hypothetical protein
VADRQLAVSGEWALASDGIQWILQRSGRAVWFVRSERSVLERGMAAKRVPSTDANRLLAGLPDTFDEWKAPQTQFEASNSDLNRQFDPDTACALQSPISALSVAFEP